MKQLKPEMAERAVSSSTRSLDALQVSRAAEQQTAKAPNSAPNHSHNRCTTVSSPNGAYGAAHLLHRTAWYGAMQRVVVTVCTMMQVILYVLQV